MVHVISNIQGYAMAWFMCMCKLCHPYIIVMNTNIVCCKSTCSTPIKILGHFISATTITHKRTNVFMAFASRPTKVSQLKIRIPMQAPPMLSLMFRPRPSTLKARLQLPLMLLTWGGAQDPISMMALRWTFNLTVESRSSRRRRDAFPHR